MRAIRERQSDLSIATAAFLFMGTLFAVLNVTVFRMPGVLRLDVVATAAVSATTGSIVLLLGRRFSKTWAMAIMVASMLSVVITVWFSPSEIRALNMGLLFFPYLIYVVWFLPMRLARVFAYSWLALYIVAVITRYGEVMYPVLVTLSLTGLMLGELIGLFKRRLVRVSITDPLCDIWNKRGFERLLARAMNHARRRERQLAIVYIDLDGFKSVNDLHGHGEGDRLLREFARDIGDRVRPQDVLARFGGDEFALLLTDCNEEQAERTVERLQQQVTVTPWSYGVSVWKGSESAAEFISRADLLMLDRKQQRKAQAAAAGQN